MRASLAGHPELQEEAVRLLDVAAAGRRCVRIWKRSAAELAAASRAAEFSAAAAHNGAGADVAREILRGTPSSLAVSKVGALVVARQRQVAAAVAAAASQPPHVAAAAAVAAEAVGAFRAGLRLLEERVAAINAASGSRLLVPWQLQFAMEMDRGDDEVEGDGSGKKPMVVLDGGRLEGPDGLDVFEDVCTVCGATIQNGRLIGWGAPRLHCLDCPSTSICDGCAAATAAAWEAVSRSDATHGAGTPSVKPGASAGAGVGSDGGAVAGGSEAAMANPVSQGTWARTGMPTFNSMAQATPPSSDRSHGHGHGHDHGKPGKGSAPATSADARSVLLQLNPHLVHRCAREANHAVVQRESVFDRGDWRSLIAAAFHAYQSRPCLGEFIQAPTHGSGSGGGRSLFVRSFHEVGQRWHTLLRDLEGHAVLAPRAGAVLCLPPCALWYELEWAIVAAGACSAGVHHEWPTQDILTVLRRADATVLFVDRAGWRRLADFALANTSSAGAAATATATPASTGAVAAAFDSRSAAGVGASDGAAVAGAGAGGTGPSAAAVAALLRVLPASLVSVVLIDPTTSPTTAAYALHREPEVELHRSSGTSAGSASLPAGEPSIQLLSLQPIGQLDLYRPDYGCVVPLSLEDEDRRTAVAGRHAAVRDAGADDDGSAAELPVGCFSSPTFARDPVVLMFSSGSTGTPKGLKVTGSRWLRDVDDACFSRPHVEISMFPAAWGADKLTVWRSMLNGGSVAFCRPGLGTLFADLQAARPAQVLLVPLMAAALRDEARAAYARELAAATAAGEVAHVAATRASAAAATRAYACLGGNVRQLGLGGAAVPPDLSAWLRSTLPCTVIEAYGTSESAGIASDGKLIQGVQVRLISRPELGYTPEDKPLPRGEIAVKSPLQVARDDWLCSEEEAAAVAARYLPDGWFLTGDLGALLPDGRNIVILGRVGGLSKLANGQFLSPERVESVLGGEADIIAQACVLPTPANDAAAVVVALAAGADRSSVAARVRAACSRANLAAHERPALVVVADEAFTPGNGLLTSNGKLNRAAISARFKAALQAAADAAVGTDASASEASAASADGDADSLSTDSDPSAVFGSVLRRVHAAIAAVLDSSPEEVARSAASGGSAGGAGSAGSAPTLGDLGLDSLRLVRLQHSLQAIQRSEAIAGRAPSVLSLPSLADLWGLTTVQVAEALTVVRPGAPAAAKVVTAPAFDAALQASGVAAAAEDGSSAAKPTAAPSPIHSDAVAAASSSSAVTVAAASPASGSRIGGVLTIDSLRQRVAADLENAASAAIAAVQEACAAASVDGSVGASTGAGAAPIPAVPESATGDHASATAAGHRDVILITGVTGFLGRHVLAVLAAGQWQGHSATFRLQSGDVQMQVVAVARGATDAAAAKRVWAALAQAGLPAAVAEVEAEADAAAKTSEVALVGAATGSSLRALDALAALPYRTFALPPLATGSSSSIRISAARGDVSAPGLGLSKHVLAALLPRLHTLINVAADVRFLPATAAYNMLRPANVEGAAAAAALVAAAGAACSSARPSATLASQATPRLHHVSTLSVPAPVPTIRARDSAPSAGASGACTSEAEAERPVSLVVPAVVPASAVDCASLLRDESSLRKLDAYALSKAVGEAAVASVLTRAPAAALAASAAGAVTPAGHVITRWPLLTWPVGPLNVTPSAAVGGSDAAVPGDCNAADWLQRIVDSCIAMRCAPDVARYAPGRRAWPPCPAAASWHAQVAYLPVDAAASMLLCAQANEDVQEHEHASGLASTAAGMPAATGAPQNISVSAMHARAPLARGGMEASGPDEPAARASSKQQQCERPLPSGRALSLSPAEVVTALAYIACLPTVPLHAWVAAARNASADSLSVDATLPVAPLLGSILGSDGGLSLGSNALDSLDKSTNITRFGASSLAATSACCWAAEGGAPPTEKEAVPEAWLVGLYQWLASTGRHV